MQRSASARADGPVEHGLGIGQVLGARL